MKQKLKLLKNVKDENKQKILREIEQEIKAYEEGNLFYGTTIEPKEGTQKYMEDYDNIIQVMENQNIT